MVRRLPAILLVMLTAMSVSAQSLDRSVRSAVSDYFAGYSCNVSTSSPVKVKSTVISSAGKTISVTLDEVYSYQLLTQEMVEETYAGLRSALPSQARNYALTIISDDREISQLVPESLRKDYKGDHPYRKVRNDGPAWVTPLSKPYKVDKGLTGHHLAVTPSHGYYYSIKDSVWKWQRPSLYSTREDLLTQSIVYPFLIPMLENAGAVVWSARERDWQVNQVIVDNTSPRSQFRRSGKWEEVFGQGYSQDSSRICQAQTASAERIQARRKPDASVTWRPSVPEDGDYAVYVSYRSFPQSISDAHYTVHHAGGTTEFLVNQKIGGGTWVYLGTFHFHGGTSDNAKVVLDNSSSSEGVVSADAVRFGGGMGDVSRFGQTSGKPRYLEGAKYYARFAGAPDSVYLKYDNKDDYNEDIQTRPRFTNYISGGSAFNRINEGAGVPIELSLALHTDAGYGQDSIIGTLGIYTTRHNDGVLGSGISRDISRDLAHFVLNGLDEDMTRVIGQDWNLRGLWDKNYCESREPNVPSMILELLSHQNFKDMKFAHNPMFRFEVARSVYKSLLRYEAFMNGTDYCVQPLPVTHFRITETGNRGQQLKLQWNPAIDPAEPTAKPDGYIVYTRIGDGGFDNGTHVRRNSFEFTPEPGLIYSFKVTAVNDGGESMPSEILSASLARKSRYTVLVVNGFQRVSSPYIIDSPDEQGLDVSEDFGVQYGVAPVFSGIQQGFDPEKIGIEDEGGLGFSGDEYDGMLVAGNTFDYAYVHGRSIRTLPECSFVSCSRAALEDGLVSLEDYMVVDLILGLQKRDYSDVFNGDGFQTFPASLRKIIDDYLSGRGRLLVSGSYVGADLRSAEERDFLKNVLHCSWGGSVRDGSEDSVTGLKSTIGLSRDPGKTFYPLQYPDIIQPEPDGVAIFAYSKSRYSAGTAYLGRNSRVVVLGFPIENIKENNMRDRVMASLISYLMQ